MDFGVEDWDISTIGRKFVSGKADIVVRVKET